MTRSFTEIKQAIAWQLKESIGEDRFDFWFGDHDSLAIHDGHVIVSAADELSLAFIKQQFHDALREALNAVLGSSVALKFVLGDTVGENARQHNLFTEEQLADAGLETPVNKGRNRTKPAARRRAAANAARHQDMPLLRGAPAKSPFDLESFRFGKHNLLLESAIKELFSDPGKFNPLVLHGPVGCGKTHLLTGIVSHARQTRRYKRCVNITAEQFTSSFIAALQNRTLTDFRVKFRNLDLLAMDDIQFLAGKQATVVEFQNTIETLLRSGKQIVVTADRPIAELRFADDSLFNRLSAGLTCPMRYPDLQGRIEILRQLAVQRGMSLAPGVERLVAERIVRDVRLLSGAINRLKAASLVSDESLDGAFAEKYLADLIHAQSPVVSLARIEQAVCEVCGVDANELKSNKRIKRISTARMLAMWLSRKYTSAGLAEIGKYYGGRSHSTVVAAEKKINGLLQSDAAVELRSRQTSISSAVGRLQNTLDVG